MRDQLEADKPSERAAYLWEWFKQIKAGAANGMTNAITWAVLKDWSEMMGIHLHPWEARTLVMVDNIVRAKTEKRKPKKVKDAN